MTSTEHARDTAGAPPTHAPDVEARRQRIVDSLGVVGGPTERLDRITRLATRVLRMPLSSVTVLDEDRAWFAGATGFPDRHASRRDTYCDRTAALDELVVIEDTLTDPHAAVLPPTVQAGIRFYAGHPLHDPSGHVVGTLCLFDVKPRTLDDEDLLVFRDLAAWAQQELVSSSEMVQAGRVQASLLPAGGVRVPGWDIDGICLPALAVGGDFFDLGVAQDVAHLVVGDVMGKGTSAALLGAGVRAAVRGTHAAVTAGVDLGVTLTQVGRAMSPDLERAESFVTIFEAAVQLDDASVRFVDAGCGLGLLVPAAGAERRLSSRERPVGVLPDDHWTEQEIDLAAGDRLLVFSDGLLDLLDDPLDWVPEVASLVRGAPDVRTLLGSVVDLAGDRVPTDDVTVVAVFREAGA